MQMSQAATDSKDTHWWRIGLSIVTIAALTALIYSVFTQALSTKQAADSARASIEAIQTSITQGKFKEIPTSLTQVMADTETILNQTNTWQWQLLSALPVTNTSAQALPILAQSLQDTAKNAEPIANAIQNSTSTADLVTQLPALIAKLEPLAQSAELSIKQLERINQASLRFGLDSGVIQAINAFQSIIDANEIVQTNGTELTSMLGFDQPRTYLVMLQNPTEVRGSGGLFSAYLLLELANGSPAIKEAGSRKALDLPNDQVEIPYAGIADPGEELLWRDYFEAWASFNTSADFPTTAKLAQAGMAKRGTPISGVIAIDPYAVQAILAGTGPVENQGVTIDATNAGDFFTKDIYSQYPDFPDVNAKDELALGLTYAAIDSLLKRPLDVGALTQSIPQAVDNGNIKIWSANQNEQAFLSTFNLTHAITDKPSNEFRVSLNNSTGGKLDSYVTTTATEQRDQCLITEGEFAGMSINTLSITMANNAPENLPPYVDLRLDNNTTGTGATKILVSIYAPINAQFQKLTSPDSTPSFFSTTTKNGEIWTTSIELGRGQEKQVTLEFAADPTTTGIPNC
jgi:hypothetical protein